jgi:hypothetical protein
MGVSELPDAGDKKLGSVGAGGPSSLLPHRHWYANRWDHKDDLPWNTTTWFISTKQLYCK